MIVGHTPRKPECLSNSLDGKRTTRIEKLLKHLLGDFVECCLLRRDLLLLQLRLKLLNAKLRCLKLRLDRLGLLADEREAVAQCRRVYATTNGFIQFVE